MLTFGGSAEEHDASVAEMNSMNLARKERLSIS